MMAGMRRRIAYSIGWLAATVAAIALAWLGVRSVLVTSVFAAPMTIAAPAVPVTTAPAPSATATASASPRASAAAAPSVSATAAPTPADEHVYSTPGGTAVLKVTATTVAVLSSSPNDAFTAQVTNGTDWLRVDFLTGNGAHGWSVVASWYLHAPTIQVVSF
jgi:hypothetical protein